MKVWAIDKYVHCVCVTFCLPRESRNFSKGRGVISASLQLLYPFLYQGCIEEEGATCQGPGDFKAVCEHTHTQEGLWDNTHFQDSLALR